MVSLDGERDIYVSKGDDWEIELSAQVSQAV
jgi:hypothetical protein